MSDSIDLGPPAGLGKLPQNVLFATGGGMQSQPVFRGAT